MTSPVELTRDEVRDLLTELGARLQAAGVEATLYIVGGAAIALEFDVRRVTADVDAVFHPATTVRSEVASMAAERGLPPDWLNDRARAFVPGGDDEAVSFAVPGISVALASPGHLLAMKMAAARPGQDIDDLVLLFDVLDVTSAERAADIALACTGRRRSCCPSATSSSSPPERCSTGSADGGGDLRPGGLSGSRRSTPPPRPWPPARWARSGCRAATVAGRTPPNGRR